MLLEEIQNNISYRPITGVLPLYHGSKSGIYGHIRPDYFRARRACDFGRGFYLGTRPNQVKTLACRGEDPTFYEISLDLDGLDCVTLNDLAWALFIAYQRQVFLREDSPGLYEFVAGIDANCDVVIGPIADDRIATVLTRFFNKTITDAALLACMRGMDLGTQYALKTQRACDKANILSKHVLTQSELQALVSEAEGLRVKGNRLATDMQLRHRGIGQYFDEILTEGGDLEHALGLFPNPFV